VERCQASSMGISWRALIAAVSVACFTATTGVGAVLAADAEQAAALKRIIGTKEANVLRGTANADFVDGRAGNDVLYGLGGNDRLIGGAGSDRIVCGRGRDTVSADPRDKVARDCEVVHGSTRPPPPPPLPSAIPVQLLGTWNRNITDGAVIGDDHRGIWSMTLDRVGVVVMKEPPGAHPPGSGHDTITTTVEASADGQLLSAPVLAAHSGASIAGKSPTGS
jgi:RTX calcium-binding nonapeptide repeat (4 copies)